MLVNICMKFHEDILKGFKIIEQTWFCPRTCYLQSSKVHYSKIHIQELRFLRSACLQRWLIFLWSFMKISSTVLKLLSRHNFVIETATYKVQRGITQNIYISKSYGSCALHVVRCWLIFKWSFQVTEQTRFCDRQTDVRIDDQGKNNRSPNPKVGRHYYPKMKKGNKQCLLDTPLSLHTRLIL